MALNSDATEPTAPVMLSIFDGQGLPFSGPVVLRVHNGRDIPPISHNATGPHVDISVPFHDGIGDFYAINITSNGYQPGACFFKANSKVLAQPKVLLIKNNSNPNFVPWDMLKLELPQVTTFLQIGTDEKSARANYEEFIVQKPAALACLLNLIQAMQEIDLDGHSPLSYFKAICWDNTMAQDRFFGFADPAIIPIVRAAAAKGEFAEEKDCSTFHRGATCSWKQIAFPVANVQLTFHENDTRLIDGLKCVRIEPDIDLYKDLVEHGFAEVFPNLLTHGLTNPCSVFCLRWATAEDYGGALFNPGYQLA